MVINGQLYSYSEKPAVTKGEEQALKKAQSYLSHMAFSYTGLIKQLEYEGFTHDQAEYGVSQNGL